MIGSAISWVSVSGGDWGTGSNWSSGSVPTAGTSALIALPASVTVTSPAAAASLTIANAAASVEVLASTLALSGLLNIQAGSFILDGTLAGGIVAATGGTFVVGSFAPLLAGVTYEGTLVVGPFESLTIDTITLLGAGGIGAGVLAVTAGTATFGVTQTLTAGTISLGNQGAYPGFTPAINVASGVTLTLGAGVLAQSTGNSEAIGGAVINAGTIAAAVSGDVLTITGSLVNQKLIAISNHDEVIVAPGAALTNPGTIRISTGGTLDLLGGFTNAGSINASGGTILVGGAVTQAELLALDASGGAVVLAGTLDNTGGTLQVGAGTALGTLAVEGGIRGGVIQDKGGGIVLAGGTLDNVAYQGTLAVTTSPSQPNAILDGLTLSGPSGIGSGVLLITGGLEFANTESLGAGIVDLGGPVGPASISTAANVTATLGAGVDLEQTGAVVALGGMYALGTLASSSSGQILVNQGTLDAGFAQGSMTLGSGAELINRGLMEVRANDTFLAQETLLNAGTLLIGSGGTLAVLGSSLWSNTGTILGAGGTVVLGGPITNAELLSFAGSGAAIIVAGTLDNSAGTLAIGAGSALGTITLGAGGVIRGGVIADGGGGLIAASGTLDAVTYQGTLGLTHRYDSATVADGITLTRAGGGLGAVNLLGDGAALTFSGNETLSATVNIGGAGMEADLVTGPPGSVLTLGPSAIVTQAGLLAGLNGSGGTLVNEGTIQAALFGGRFQVFGGALGNAGTISVANADVMTIGSLVNSGQVTVASGGVLTLGQYSTSPGGHISETNATLNLNGSLTLAALATISRSGGIVAMGGTLDLGAGILAVGGATALGQLRDNGVIANGTIADAGAGMVFYGSGGATGVLRNVTYRGLVNLMPALSNLIVQGLTATGTGGAGAGTVNVLGAGGTLTFQGSQTFDNATINFGSNTKTVSLAISDPNGNGAVLTLGTLASLQQRGALAEINIDRGLGDALVNNGLIAANSPNGQMIILGGTFTNNGKVVVAVGDTLSLEADSVSNLVSGLMWNGDWEVNANSTLNLGMEAYINNMDAVMVLNGPGSQVLYYDTTLFQTVSLEQTLRFVGPAGVLVIENGRIFNDPSRFYIIGKTTLAGGILLGSPVSVGVNALLNGWGTVTAGAINDSGHVQAQGGALVLNGPLLGAAPVGNALIDSGATLIANSTFNVPVGFEANTGTLALAQANSMSGLIYGFTGSDAIDLVNVGTTGLTLSYTPGAGAGVLTVKSGTAVAASLHFNGNYVTANFRFTSDGHGGTLILDPPVASGSSGSDWAVTLGDLAPPPSAPAVGSAGQGGTIAGTGVVGMGAPPEPTSPVLLAHQ